MAFPPTTPWRLNRDFSLFPEVTRVNSGTELEGWNVELDMTELMRIQMRRYRRSPAVGILENKLLGSQVLSDHLQFPVQDVIYGGFALRPLGKWPQYERQEFLKTMADHANDNTHNFVVKPLTNAGSAGVLVMNSEKWEKGNWTMDLVADHVEKFFVGIDYSTLGQQYERRGVIVQTSFLSDEADVVPGNFNAKGKSGINLELKVLVVFGELTSARVETMPWSGGNHIDTSFCEESLTENGHLPLLRVENIEFPEKHFENIRTIVSQHLPELKAMAQKAANAYGSDMFRLDVFITESGRLVVNELTYPSYVGMIDVCSPNRLFDGYQKEGRGLELADSSVFIRPILKSIEIKIDDYLATPDYIDLWHNTEEAYDNAKWGCAPDDEQKTGWLPPTSSIQMRNETIESSSTITMLRSSAVVGGVFAYGETPLRSDLQVTLALLMISILMLIRFRLRTRKCDKKV